MHRAAHQLLDNPAIFTDPLALRIIGTESAEELRSGRGRHVQPESAVMRAFLVARSRVAEDSFAAAAGRGVRQYVLLGAGLDTFAYRASGGFPGLSVYEVDHPATQAWKRERLSEAEIAIPECVTYAPVNFERETLKDGLARAGFDFGRPAFFAWLGVVPYLTREAVMGTLRFIAQETKSGSEVVFDYPESGGDPAANPHLAALAKRVAALSEPLLSAFKPAELARDLASAGFVEVEDLDADALNARYFKNRSDGLKLGGRGHVMRART